MIRPPQPPRPFAVLLRDAQRAGRLEAVFQNAFDPTPGGEYLPWDDLQHRPPPGDLSPHEWWLGTKFARRPLLRDLPLVGVRDAVLRYATPDPVTERLQRVDRDASGQILMAEQAVSPGHRDRYVVSSLIEESIMSSLLEGAATTRREAKEMLRTGRKPTTKGERMVLNNFRAMREIKTLTNENLSQDLIRHLHETLTDRAADAGEPGRYRGPDEEDRFGVWSGERRLYKPPPYGEVEAYVEQVCSLINGTDGPYVHPVIKAVVLHFWIGYVHPFEDGNGRTARALFYWFMLREGYGLFEFVSISSVLTEAHATYARSYLYTETDDNDLTYFLLFHLDVIDRALDSVQSYIRRKVQEIRETKAVLHPDAELNPRQIALLRHALQHPDAVYTFESHKTSHGVVYQTARTDLLALADRGLLTAGQAGRKYVFRVPPDLSERVRDSS